MRKQSGFSLVELMIALVIGLIVVGGLVSVLMASRQAFTLQQSNNFNQENIRFASARLSWSLRMADFWGGTKPDKITALTDTAGIGGDGDCNGAFVMSVGPGAMQNGVYGYDGGEDFPIKDCVDPANYVKGSDVLVVRYADVIGYDPDKGPDTQDFNGDASAVPNTTSVFLVAGLGQQAALFRKDAAVPAAPLSVTSGRYVYPYQFEMYYLRPCADLGGADKCSATSDGGAPSPSLVRMRMDATGKLVSEVVVDGIEQLSFEYASRVDNGANPPGQTAFGPAATTDWQNVTQVRTTFVARAASRDMSIKHSGEFDLTGHCAYKIDDTGAVSYPDTAVTNGCSKALSGAYGDQPQQYARILSQQVVLLRNRVRG
ncbi:PilW family protein [Luteibacter aegosomaticola]|uniref:PilW family protein n=1 Tax=Luteibacter aegosomaticola TaxID=2911538 RepID=UPI001FF8E5F4|nr:PilW family protein [Luteibacter aegosomaticola]UPG88888.1 PilW family protein [Luteibacter aegosomaticola]